LLGVDKAVVEGIDLDSGDLIASVRSTGSMRNCCGACQRRSPRY